MRWFSSCSRMPPGVASDDGLAFPHGLGDREAEALAQRFLQHDVGRGLQGVDGPVAVVARRQHVDVRVSLGRLAHLLSTISPSGSSAALPAGQHQLQAGNELLGQSVGLDDSQRVLEPVETRDLQDDRPLRVDAELLQHSAARLAPSRGRFFSLRGSMLGGMRNTGCGIGLGERVQGEDAGIVAGEELAEVLPNGSVGVAEIDVAPPDPLAPALRSSSRGEERVVGRG